MFGQTLILFFFFFYKNFIHNILSKTEIYILGKQIDFYCLRTIGKKCVMMDYFKNMCLFDKQIKSIQHTFINDSYLKVYVSSFF